MDKPGVKVKNLSIPFMDTNKPTDFVTLLNVCPDRAQFDNRSNFSLCSKFSGVDHVCVQCNIYYIAPGEGTPWLHVTYFYETQIELSLQVVVKSITVGY